MLSLGLEKTVEMVAPTLSKVSNTGQMGASPRSIKPLQSSLTGCEKRLENARAQSREVSVFFILLLEWEMYNLSKGLREGNGHRLAKCSHEIQ